jgi:hypothetical protein
MYRVALLFLLFLPTLAGAQQKCDFGNVRQLPSGNYELCEPYFQLVDKEVRLVDELKLREGLYQQKINLQEDLFKVSEQQVEIWADTAKGLNEEINKRSWWSSVSPYFYFGAGVVLTLGAAWAAGQVVK